ncbi:zinc finger CCCH domain-containing protein 6-like [Momordica charantia]|uniref:Zinc finger CCCH domain-containing protein 6-like n=1 Tax=Momordica charantia TaxID=3673 RepID=A0A6J1BVT5_MOMCH|nr:zinc finger CCCH domain-containing protein 6-like [Momordica charantia]XP_022133375.1 zinc finger CCCH domain-containing protein 6-like [Momordica charantia]
MKRSRKSRGVSWAHGVNLCQVKLFSSEDCPSKVGLKSPDHLQAKTPWMLHPLTSEFNDCPPGFEVTQSGNQLADLSCISSIKWKCPPKFVMNCNWCVAAGEESKEVESQKLREMRFLEAVYPRASAIPPGATVSVDIEDELYDDGLTPLVPVIPIEEDECEDTESDSAAVGNFSTSSLPMMASNVRLDSAIPKSATETSAVEKPIENLPDVGVDVAAAASTAMAVLMKSTEQGSMIDTNLLIKIFSDPKMIQNLTNILPLSESESGSPPIATAASVPATKPVSESVSLSLPKFDTIPKLPNGSLPKVLNGFPSMVTPALPQMSTFPASDVKPASVPGHLPALDLNKVNITIPNGGNYSKIGTVPAPVSSVRKEAQQWKDLNYYKNLVRQHGDQRDSKEQKLGQDGNNHNHHNLNMVHEMKAENLKPKIQKQCIYFNGPKGCRNGINCQFKHDISLKNQNAKRMKLCGEVTGRT